MPVLDPSSGLPVESIPGTSRQQMPPLGSDLLRRFHSERFVTRCFLSLRWRLTPYEYIASQLPTTGLILDLGCGHGLLSLTLALQAPGREVHGIDHDPARIDLARKAAETIPHVEFHVGDFTLAVRRNRDRPVGIVLMDSLHYLLPDAQQSLIEEIYQALPSGGMLQIREVDTARGASSWFNRLHELLMTTFRFTRAESLNYRTPDGWTELFRAAGFHVTSEPCGCFPFADRLFVCRK